MCHGGVDPKYLLRDTRARAKGVAFAQDKSEVAVTAGLAGFAVWVGRIAAGFASRGHARATRSGGSVASVAGGGETAGVQR